MEFQVMKSGENVLNIDIDDDNDKQQKYWGLKKDQVEPYKF